MKHFFLVAGLIFLAACSKNNRLAKHLERAGDQFSDGNYAAAELEFLNALKIDNESNQAISSLGIIYYDQVRLRKAFPFLAQASKTDPRNSDVAYRLGFLHLMSGDPATARDQAIKILQESPEHIHAPILLASAANNDELHLENLEILARYQDLAPSNASIDAAFAIIEARRNKRDKAQERIDAALTKDNRNYYVYSILSSLHEDNGNSKAALESLEKAVELSPLRSSNRIKLAQRYLESGNIDGYHTLIGPVLENAPKFAPGQLISARYYAKISDLEIARRHLDNLFSLDPNNHDGLVLSGNIYLNIREYGKALREMSKLSELYPKSPLAQYHLARAELANNQISNAKNALQRCLAINPSFIDAAELMTQLQIQSGEFSAAETNLIKLLQHDPESLSLQLNLARAKRGQGYDDDALAIYRDLENKFSENAQLPLLRAQLFAQKNDPERAKAAVEESLRRDPQFALALDLMTSFLIAERRFDAAISQVKERVKKDPENPIFHVIEAKVQIAQQKWDQAEESLLRAIDLDPDQRTPYMLLSQVYVQDDKRSAAIKRLQQVVAKDPKDVSALMIMCGIYEYQENFVKARDTYESILDIDPNFPPALNNLAYMYSEYFDNHDEAYKYANRARQFLPHDPAIADTLGWIIFKRGDYKWAQSLIKESSEKLSGNAEVRYHLGMTYYMLGEADKAKKEFEFALSNSTDFNGKEDLEIRMEILALREDSISAMDIDDLHRRSKEQKSDPILLEILAKAYQASGNTDSALETYDAVLSINPDQAQIMRQKAWLLKERGDFQAGFELAKEAYKLQPNDPSISSLLGQFAFAAGNHTWSTSLLQSSAAMQPGNPETQYQFAKSLISVGRIRDALDTLKKISPEDHTLESNALIQFIEAIELSKPHTLDTSGLEFELALSWASAYQKSRIDDGSTAIPDYEQLLDMYPSFNVAKRELALIRSRSGDDSDEVLKLAKEAARAYPGNQELRMVIESIENS